MTIAYPLWNVDSVAEQISQNIFLRNNCKEFNKDKMEPNAKLSDEENERK